MGTFGFSYVGMVFLLMLFLPNVLWARRLPSVGSPAGENVLLLVLERIGQVCCACTALLFRDTNLAPWSAWSWWLVASFAALLLYEGCWVRFLHRPTAEEMYRRLWVLPVPLASLPAVAFLLLGGYGRLVWLVVSAVVFGVGHIGIHWRRRRELGVL